MARHQGTRAPSQVRTAPLINLQQADACFGCYIGTPEIASTVSQAMMSPNHNHPEKPIPSFVMSKMHRSNGA